MIGGCSTVKYNYAPKVTNFSIPELDVVVTKGLGESLLDQGLSTKRVILNVVKKSSISAYKIKPGKLIKVGEDENSEYFSQDAESGLIINSGLLMSYPDITAVVQYKKKSDEFCITRPADLTVCGELTAERDTETVITNKSFRQTLIYSGRIENKLKISYREYGANIDRSAFSTDVEYDLNEGSLIGYSGARLEVISATNIEIKYKVISNFNTN